MANVFLAEIEFSSTGFNGGFLFCVRRSGMQACACAVHRLIIEFNKTIMQAET